MRVRSQPSRDWRIAVIDGPNMPNLGARDPGIYGPIKSIADLQDLVRRFAEDLEVTVTCMTSNHEGEILSFIHGSAAQTDGYLINPAGLTTYGEATRHALADTRRPYVEVHFANLAVHLSSISGTRPLESRFTKSATGLVMGLRQHGYLAALLALVLSLDDEAFLGAANGA